ncbi:uncharacterized protein LOC106646657 [Copidosoma floridanum]|uniref:uncharacterized protein LOC106646657 n=1 Tax=Copidosoma floridanum TaxID=29053 RepID=UPI0006C979A6|nr:uncharacterized protein LOC106646657 [Copidosoma floridanum]
MSKLLLLTFVIWFCCSLQLCDSGLIKIKEENIHAVSRHHAETRHLRCKKVRSIKVSTVKDSTPTEDEGRNDTVALADTYLHTSQSTESLASNSTIFEVSVIDDNISNCCAIVGCRTRDDANVNYFIQKVTCECNSDGFCHYTMISAISFKIPTCKSDEILVYGACRPKH